jgi:predicted N-acetyltransferase YhbS
MITIRLASESDNADLRALGRETPMTGAVSLRIDREPDFFELLRLRGGGATFVASDKGRVIGCVSATFRDVYVDGSPQRLAYLGDLRVSPIFGGSRAAFELIRSVAGFVKDSGVDIGFCVVASGNERMLSLLATDRPGMPRMEGVGEFIVSHILPSSRDIVSRDCEVEEMDPQHTDEVCRLCNEVNMKYQLGLVITQSQLRANGIRTLTARRKGVLVATASSFDAQEAKQNVLLRMPRLLGYGLRVAQRLNPAYRAPTSGQSIRTLYLRCFACIPGEEAALGLLIHHVRREAFQRGCACVCVGMHRRDRTRRALRLLPRYGVKAEGFVSSGAGNRAVVARIATGITMDDFALV